MESVGYVSDGQNSLTSCECGFLKKTVLGPVSAWWFIGIDLIADTLWEGMISVRFLKEGERTSATCRYLKKGSVPFSEYRFYEGQQKLGPLIFRVSKTCFQDQCLIAFFWL